jgi:N-acetylglucosamine-6-sulfatase
MLLLLLMLAGVQPNIVVVLTDDQGWETVGKKHSVDGQTPVMQQVTSRLVNGGVTFKNAYATTALCGPSRASILTGLYAHNHGVIRNEPPHGGDSFVDDNTLPVWLQNSGYTTSLIGKYINGYGEQIPGSYIPPGWNDWHAFLQPEFYQFYNYDMNENGVIRHFDSDPGDYTTDVVAARAVNFIAQAQEPFFLLLTPNAPHAPAIPAPRHIGSFNGLPLWRPASFNESDFNDKPLALRSLIPKLSPKDISRVDQFRKSQLESLQAVDEAVGSVLDALEAKGVEQNTIVVFASDNGMSWGEHRWVGKTCHWEECERIVFIVKFPPMTATRTEDSNVLNIDLAPTLAELAGVNPPFVNGVSLVPLLVQPGPGPEDRDWLQEHWKLLKLGGIDLPRFYAIQSYPWKFTQFEGEGEMYDLSVDMFELLNVSGLQQNQKKKQELKLRLNELLEE